MSDFQQKRKIRGVMYSKLSILVLLVLIFFLAKATYNLYGKYRVSAGDYTIVKNDYDSLKTRKDMLDSEIDRLRTDNGIEEEIRSKFNVAKPGETVVVIINNSTTSTKDVQQKSDLWSRFLDFFK